MSTDSNFIKYLRECAASHIEHKDYDGERAILCAVVTTPEFARVRYPDDVEAIDNAVAYAEQQCSEEVS